MIVRQWNDKTSLNQLTFFIIKVDVCSYIRNRESMRISYDSIFDSVKHTEDANNYSLTEFRYVD